MSLNLNHVILAGRMTRDPQVKALPNDRVVANFGIAINRRLKGADGETKEEAVFLDVEAWGRTAELVGQYLAKGSPLFLEGRLRIDSWQDKDGNRRTQVRVVAEHIQFVAPRPAPAGATAGARPAPAAAAPALEAVAEAQREEPPF